MCQNTLDFLNLGVNVASAVWVIYETFETKTVESLSVFVDATGNQGPALPPSVGFATATN